MDTSGGENQDVKIPSVKSSIPKVETIIRSSHELQIQC